MAFGLVDGVSFTAASGGTGTFVFGSSRSSFLTLAQANANGVLVNGQTVSYLAQDSLSNPTQREWGHGTYSSGGNSIARTTVLGGTSGPGSAVSFSVAPIVSLTALAEDLAPITFGESVLYRDGAANTLAQGNGANAQTLRLYNTTDQSGTNIAPTNYERGFFDWIATANQLTIGTQKGGTGSARNVLFSVDAQSLFDMGAGLGGFIRALVPLYLSVATNVNISEVNSGVLLVSGGTNGGFINWLGQKRVTSDFTVTSSTTLTNITGLSVNVGSGRTYQFETELYVTDAAAGGVQAAIAGTATATAIQYTGFTIADNAIKGKANATALGTAVGSTTTTETAGIIVRITGTITVNAAGTLTVQMAQNTSNGTATTAKRGSYFVVQDIN
jgi:hypothetical protein